MGSQGSTLGPLFYNIQNNCLNLMSGLRTNYASLSSLTLKIRKWTLNESFTWEKFYQIFKTYIYFINVSSDANFVYTECTASWPSLNKFMRKLRLMRECRTYSLKTLLLSYWFYGSYQHFCENYIIFLH